MLHVVRYPFEPLDDEKPQKLKRKLENSTKNSKLKGKTQKSAFFETPGARKACKKEACFRLGAFFLSVQALIFFTLKKILTRLA